MSFRNVTILDITSADVPVEVYNAATAYWADYELGNDYYYVPWHAEVLEENEDKKYQAITDYIIKNGEDPYNGSVLIHFWW